jgi:hypothetical protein
MGFRFQKRARIFKGLTLNMSKSGTSWTLGGKGVSVNVRGDNVTGNAGIPGTGISYREGLDNPSTAPGARKSVSGLGTVLLLLLCLAVLGFIFGY